MSERSLSVEDICNAAANRGGADVSASAMAHATELFLKEMAYQLCNGYSVNTGYFTAGTSIRALMSDLFEHSYRAMRMLYDLISIKKF